MRAPFASAVLASIVFSASASLAQWSAPAPQFLPWAVAEPALPPFTGPAPELSPAQLGPRVLKWNEGEVIPRGYYPVRRIRSGLVAGGAVLFDTAWVPMAVTWSLAGFPASVIPVLGPFVVAAQTAAPGFGGSFNTTWLVVDGLQQAAGLSMLIAGLVAKQTVLLRADLVHARAWWLPAPMSFGPQSGGLGIRGAM